MATRRITTAGADYTIEQIQREAALKDREAAELGMDAHELRLLAERCACPECEVMVTIPTTRQGALVPLRGYATHDLSCPRGG